MIDEYGNTVTKADVERILRDSCYRAIMQKVRDDQVSTFIHSAPGETEAREEAHTILRALDKIEQAFKSVVTEEAIKEKRNK